MKKNQHEAIQLEIQFNLKTASEIENVVCRNTKTEPKNLVIYCTNCGQ